MSRSQVEQYLFPTMNLDDRGRHAAFLWSLGDAQGPLSKKMRAGDNLDFASTRVDSVGQVGLGDMRDDIEHALTQGRTTKPTYVWRGMALTQEEAHVMFPIGGEVADPSFLATSRHKLKAEQYAQASGRRKPYMVQCLLPTGTPVMLTNALSSEVVLPAGLSGRVVDVIEDDDPPRIVVKIG